MIIESPPESSDIKRLRDWCFKLQQKLLEDNLFASATWDPGSIATTRYESMNVTVTGAELGDYAMASFSIDIGELILTANVTGTNEVKCSFENHTAGAIDLGEGTVYVRVLKRTF